MGQFLTAVFKLKPTRCKAAALERVRVRAEEAFWSFMNTARASAEEAAKLKTPRERKEATRALCAGVAGAAGKAGLPESVAHGLARDIEMAVSSFVELTAKGHEASWPERDAEQEPQLDAALALLAQATDRDGESAARDALARVRRGARLRPIVLARARDAALVKDSAGRLAAVLNVGRAADPRARVARVREGFDPTTGEALPALKSKAKIVVPLECSRWHENKFLSGRAALRSSIVFRRGEDWFMAAQFEMPDAQAAQTGAVLGIDRGIVYPVSAAVVTGEGAVLEVFEPAGAEIGATIRKSDERRRNEQRRRGITTFRHQDVVRHSLHQIANQIVADAVKHGAQVVVEKLDDMKSVITAPRAKGARKGGWRKVLKRAQLGELEQMLEYKLKLAGLPKLRDVVAAGTSQTCPACGHKAKENRPERDVFKCIACGHEAHADQNAAVVIARRGVLMRTIKKGQKLDELHKDMVVRLSARGDGGLGHRGKRAAVVVPALASGDTANEDAVCPATASPGQEFTFIGQNPGCRVFAARFDAFSGDSSAESSSHSKDLRGIGAGDPSDAG